MAITLREIRDEDLEQIMEWRMSPDITRYMNTDPKLTLEGQRVWLSSLQMNSKVMNWLVLVEEKPVGVINLADINWEEGNTSWGYYIGDKASRSLKLALSLELSLYGFCFDVLGFGEVHNEAFSLNSGVVRLHRMCGNEIVRIGEGEVEKNGVRYDVTHLSITKEKWEEMKPTLKYEQVDFNIPEVAGPRLIPHHLGIAVANMERAIEKYELLGYVREGDIVADAFRHVDIQFMREQHTDMCVELIAPQDESSPVSRMLKDARNMATPYHVCYETDALEKSISLLKKKGFAVASAPAVAPAIEGKKVAFLVQRDAGMIELVER